MSKVCVFGASGKTGNLVVKEAVERGHEVIAFCRSSSSALRFPNGTNVVVGDLSDRKAVGKGLDRADAVVCALGQRPPHTEVFCAPAMTVILECMRVKGVNRLLCITGAMVGDYPRARSLFFGAMAKMFARNRPEVAKDRALQEQLVMESKKDWTVVKPPRLTDSPARGRYRLGPDLRVGLLSKISRGDLARFLVEEIEARKYIRQCVVIKH